MKNTNQKIVNPIQIEKIKQMGEQIKLARKRRKLSMEQVASRANISRSTLSLLESGNPGCSIATLLKVLYVLNLGDDILLIAKDDSLGRLLQDAELLQRR